MHTAGSLHGRRRFLQGLTLGLAACTARGVFAQQLAETATTGEGPFYPNKLPLDADNDLLIVNDAITPAVGTITHLSGRVLTGTGQPVRNAFVEIWQADNTGSYINTSGRQEAGNDGNFQGYGRFLSDVRGQYYFRTIKPVDYTLIEIFRAPHIHVAISRNGRRIFTTQLLVAGHPANARDPVVQEMNRRALQTLLVDFKPLPGSKIGELTAHFDVVLGRTAQELDNGLPRGIGDPEGQPRGTWGGAR
jgi:protocatechuate 3,4-dioxygenase beta subunit